MNTIHFSSGVKRSIRTKLNRTSAPTALAALFAVGMAAVVTAAPAVAQEKKPNILFIMGDDIGLIQVGAYHQGWALGETPNIDRLANEGGKFTDYYAMQSCTSGRNVFFTGMYPLRTGMIPPQLPGSPSYFARALRRSPNSCSILVTPPASSVRTT